MQCQSPMLVNGSRLAGKQADFVQIVPMLTSLCVDCASQPHMDKVRRSTPSHPHVFMACALPQQKCCPLALLTATKKNAVPTTSVTPVKSRPLQSPPKSLFPQQKPWP